jgi:hypothetical protein
MSLPTLTLIANCLTLVGMPVITYFLYKSMMYSRITRKILDREPLTARERRMVNKLK